MFEYTRAAFDKTINDFKLALHAFNILSQLIYIGYLIYAIVIPSATNYINIPLLIISVAYLLFYLVFYNKQDLASKEQKSLIKHSFKWAKIGFKLISLVTTVYGIYTATHHVTTLSVSLAALMIVAWILSLALELISIYIETNIRMFQTALEADVEAILRPVQTVGNVIKKITGKEIEPPKEPTKTRKRLDKLVESFKEKKRKKKLDSLREKEKEHETESEPKSDSTESKTNTANK